MAVAAHGRKQVRPKALAFQVTVLQVVQCHCQRDLIERAGTGVELGDSTGGVTQPEHPWLLASGLRLEVH